MWTPCTLLLPLLAGAIARAQTIEGVPVAHLLRIPPGAFVDLDTGIVLPRPEHRPLQADLHFDRDGAGFFVAPLHGATTARKGDTTPGDDWSNGRLRLGPREDTPATWFLRTERGAVARVTLAVVDPYSTASAVLQWVLAPPAAPVFLPAPTDLRCRWQGGKLAVTWQGDAPSWLIEIESGTQIRKTTSRAPRAELADLDPEGVHRVRVRGLHAHGEITMPAEATQHGPRRAPVRHAVHYPDRWYDTTGGLSLQRGEPAIDDAEVVFYLYGVYVPGGGVSRLGRGGELYRRTAELPADGHLPAYGRLDNDDVLAVRLPDGRHAKLWLVADDGSDLRSGMTVHATFLVDGRRDLLPAPAGPSFRVVRGGLQLSWEAVPGATAYRVLAPGKQEPEEVAEPGILLAGLPADRFHVARVTAVTADGEESDPLLAELHTFGDGFRVGRFTLQAQEAGFRFADGQSRTDGFDLRIESSAGGASYLRFAAPHGAARVDGAPFGDLAGADAAAYAPTIEFDDRRPGTEVFVVRTGDGGLAGVRVRHRDYPRIELDYVLRRPAR